MASSTVENYIKRIFLEHRRGERLLPLGRLAVVMGVVPGTVTTMVKTLQESGLVSYQARHGVRLTAAGRRLALRVLRRHRLIELFLVRALGFDSSEVHAEAEELEHAMSDKLLERIDQFLGRPAFDPHGDPIPSAGGKLSSARSVPLGDCQSGQRVRIARIADQAADFLRFANAHGLVPGHIFTIRGRDEAADSIMLQGEGTEHFSLGGAAAAKILVQPVGTRCAAPANGS